MEAGENVLSHETEATLLGLGTDFHEVKILLAPSLSSAQLEYSADWSGPCEHNSKHESPAGTC